MKNILAIILLSIILDPVITNAQVTQEWVATYGGIGSGYNFPIKSAIDNLGNYIVAGNSNGIGGYDYVVLKYTPSGNLIWSQRYNGIGNGYDYLSGMVLDDSGNVYVSGASAEGASLGGINWVTIKYNANGQMMWKKSLNWTGNNTDEPFGMNIDRENNIYVIGYGRTVSVYRQMITIKYSTDGDSLWTKVYRSSPTTHDWGYSVSTDDSLNVFSSGYGILPVGNEIVTVKYDTKGNEKWIRRYATNAGDYLRTVFSATDKENNLVVVGYSYFSNGYDFVTIKYTTYGDSLWTRIYNGGDIDYANCLFIDDNSNILIAGITFVDQDGDYLILKYAPNGDTLLKKIINGEGSSSDQANAILSDKEGNIYVTGASQSISFRADYLTLKLSPDGKTLWSKIYRTANQNFAYCLDLDNSENVYVSGEGGLTGGNSAIVTVKYSQLTGTSTNYLNFSNFELTNYPNPFNPITNINYNLTSTNFIEIKIFDILGHKVNNYVNKVQDAGKYSLVFDGTNLPGGIYFFSLYIDKIPKETKRMLLIK